MLRWAANSKEPGVNAFCRCFPQDQHKSKGILTKLLSIIIQYYEVQTLAFPFEMVWSSGLTAGFSLVLHSQQDP